MAKKNGAAGKDPQVHPTEIVDVDALKPHPRNYKKHPPDQIAHIAASIRTVGFYRSIVVAKDDTTLAGHGLVLAAKEMGLKRVPIVRLNVGPNDPKALKVVAGDNEIGLLADRDDRVLTEILRDVAKGGIEQLLGSGFDKMQLANLVFVTRPASEIADVNAALEWLGMPAYAAASEDAESALSITVKFRNEKDRERFLKEHPAIQFKKREGRVWSTTWPFDPQRNDPKAVKFESSGSNGAH